MDIVKSYVYRCLALLGLMFLLLIWVARSSAQSIPLNIQRSSVNIFNQSPPPSMKQIQAVEALHDAEVRWDRSGVPALIRADALSNFTPSDPSLGTAPRDYARDSISVLNRLADIFRIRNATQEFQVSRVDLDAFSYRHARVRQIYRGLPVVGVELLVHFNRAGRAFQVNGRYIPDIAVDPNPLLDVQSAVCRAQADLIASGEKNAVSVAPPAVVIYACDHEPRLAYALDLVVQDKIPKRNWHYWIDAINGAIIAKYMDLQDVGLNQPKAGVTATITGARMLQEDGSTVTVTGWYEINYYWLLNSAWKIVNGDTTGSYPDSGFVGFRSDSDWGTSDPIEISAANNFNLIQSYFLNVFNRNSYDNNGTLATVNVHVSGATNNAYWSPTDQQFFFLVGDNVTFTEFTALDISTHEYTHAVTEKTAGLVYLNDSGALSESFSDIFGAIVEFACQPDGRGAYPQREAGHADWLVGEDFSLAYTAMRDMRNPGSSLTIDSFVRQPSRYGGTHWYTGILDNGGVHINGGLQSFCFYLLSEGGQGNNDGIAYQVSALGHTNAAQVAFLALTAYCTQNTDYWAAKDAWVSAARQLNAAWVGAVEAAWAAVGISGTAHAPASHRAINDYNADSVTELTMYYYPTGDWYIYSLLLGWLAEGVNFGAYGFMPVEGDFNGGGQSDLAVYSDSLGYVAILFEETGAFVAGAVGGPGWIPVPGDYDGDGATDLAFYYYPTGYWRIYSLTRGCLAYDVPFGEYGFMPVEGDFNGGGKSDVAIYSEATGIWRIIFLETGQYIEGPLGGRGWVPVSCDYDGDGATDLVLYYYPTGYWVAYSLARGWLETGLPWGAYGYLPIVGDFNADRSLELAVYSQWEGLMCIYSPSTHARLSVSFGGPYLIPPVSWTWYSYY